MSDVLLYIKQDQVDWVFENEDIGSGSSTFKGMAREGNRVFVASMDEGQLAVLGEIPVARTYQETDHPKGWKFRVTANKGSSIRYPDPVRLANVKDKLSILKGTQDIWRQIRYPRRLSPGDAEVLSRSGRRRLNASR